MKAQGVRLFCMLIASIIVGCSGSKATTSGPTGAATTSPASPPPTCKVAPPEKSKTEVTDTVAAHLNAKFLDYVGAEVVMTSDQRMTVDETFQKVADENVACEMLLQAYLCLGMANKEALARDLGCAINSKCAGAPCASK